MTVRDGDQGRWGGTGSGKVGRDGGSEEGSREGWGPGKVGRDGGQGSREGWGPRKVGRDGGQRREVRRDGDQGR